MSLVIGIDIGTSSTKTLLLSEEGTIVSSASADYRLVTPHVGWVEQDVHDWWQAVCNTVRQIVQYLESDQCSFSVRDIKGISLSGQMNGAVFVDASGNPLRSAILWLDQRAQEQCDQANDQVGDLLRNHALHVLNPINTLAKVLWLRERQPEIYAEVCHVLLPKDWIRFKLTGTLQAEVTDASVTAVLDLKTRNWSGEILDGLGIEERLFPKVVESPTVTGQITESAASETGLYAGIPVCAGGGDMACMAVGSGVRRPGIVSVGIGTAGHVLTYAEEVDGAAFNQLWPMCHAIPGKYFWLGCSFTGGASLTWFHDQFGDSFTELIDSAEGAPIGSDGLFFMPWFQGTATPHPDANARAGWLGMTLHHTKAHMIRSLMEGVVFDLRHSLECFKQLKLPINEIYIGEGGSRSALWCQIQADVFGKDVQVLEVQDVSALGAAIIAGVGVGIFDDFESACSMSIILGETIHSDPVRVGKYELQYQRYCNLYPSLKNWFLEH